MYPNHIDATDKLNEKLRNMLSSNNVIIFGAGYAGKIVTYLCKYVYKIRVKKCFDNDSDKWGMVMWNDVVCVKPHAAIDCASVLISVFNINVAKQIEIQCRELGYQNILVLDEGLVLTGMNTLSDKECVKMIYFASTGQYLNLDRPITFNEKLQWLKVYDYIPLYNVLADKIAVKEYVRSRIGERYIIPTLKVWNSSDDIDFEDLPDSFVMKCTHDSGSVEIVNDKSNVDVKLLKEKFAKALNIDYYFMGREHGYQGIPRRIIVEPKLNDDKGGSVRDYKVFTFNGVPKIVQVDYNRFTNHTRIMYSAEWEDLGFSTRYPYCSTDVEEKPQKLKEMLELATVLSEGIAHVRVDFYIIDNKIYFGEMTFHHGGGCEKFSDEEWNYKMGEWLQLPEKNYNI